ncbi:MAG: NAD(P)-dependent alcohol dehydrogenase [Bacteroidota bacterium]
MKTFAYSVYGSPDVLKFTEIEKPTPKDNEVLIRIRAASVNPYDWRIMRGKPLFIRLMMGGLLKPKLTRPGVDVAGIVESVGRNVTEFKPGDEVFGTCRGAFAEYGCASESALAMKPANATFEQAASLPMAAITALQGLRDRGRIQRGNKVLVDGASGGVGTFAIQIAKSFGAEVTAVCSTRKMDTARAIGADQVIDYTREDFTKNGQRYDLIIAANAYHSIFAYMRALTQNGLYVMVGGSWPQIFQTMLLGPLLSRLGKKKIVFYVANFNKPDLLVLKDFLEIGKIVPVIDRRYPLSDVPEAMRYLEEGHAKGKVVITMEQSIES